MRRPYISALIFSEQGICLRKGLDISCHEQTGIRHNDGDQAFGCEIVYT